MRHVCLAIVLATVVGCGKDGDGISSPTRIRIRLHPDLGKTMSVHETDKEDWADWYVPGASPRKVEIHYTVTTLEAGDPPRKLRHHFEKALVNDEVQAALAGVAVVSELKDEAYVQTVEGSAPKVKVVVEQPPAKKEEQEQPRETKTRTLVDPIEDALQAVRYRSDTVHHLHASWFPSHPVKVGDKWPISVGAKETAVPGEGTLTKVYTKDGKRFGVIEWRFKKRLGKIHDLLTEARFDGVIDGSSTERTERWKASASAKDAKGIAKQVYEDVTDRVCSADQ